MNNRPILFRDRYDAAMQLIPHLEKYCNERGAVLAVPRGGIPIGYEIAKHFNLPLELLMSKKIGHPLNPEVAIGAVGLEDYLVDDVEGIPKSYVDTQIKNIRTALKAKYALFAGNHPPIDLEKKIVIITDDGIATGNTIMGSIRMMRQKQPKKIVVAVPVAPAETAEKMKSFVDELICLHTPEDFMGVGWYYGDFSEVSDEEVISLLREANSFGAVA
jgi:putative phosphoribosyl transferase